MYWTLRIDADPTSWELTNGVERVPALDAPEPLGVYHPLKGDLVLSPRSVGSVVFLEYKLPWPPGTRPNGCPVSEAGALYLPSPAGLDLVIHPPNLYPLASKADLATLPAAIMKAMKDEAFLPVKIAGGEVVINGAKVPFAIVCGPNPLREPAPSGANI